MPPDEDLGEEVLRAGGWSRRTLGVIALAVLAVVVGLVIGVTRGGDGTPSAQSPAPSSHPTTMRVTTTPAPAVAGNDVLDLSISGGGAEEISPVRHGRWTVTVSTLLTNYATRSFGIDGPLRVTGRGVGSTVKVKVAELAAGRYETRFRRPPALTLLRPAANVELWVELAVACRTLVPHRPPLQDLAVTIPLSGTSAPALFYFRDLVTGYPSVKEPRSCWTRSGNS